MQSYDKKTESEVQKMHSQVGGTQSQVQKIQSYDKKTEFEVQKMQSEVGGTQFEV